MAIMKIVCELCGSNEMTRREDGLFQCDCCGTKYTLEAARQMMGTVSVAGVVETRSADFQIEAGKLIKYRGEGVDVVVPSNCNRLGYRAFAELGVRSVELPAELRVIGEYAFNNCKSLERVTIPEGVTEIEHYAFGGCSSLKEISFPSSLTKIGQWVFSDCASLKEVSVPKGMAYVDFPRCTSLERVSIPKGATRVAFGGCTSLKEITIPEGVTSVSLSGCTSLKKVNIPSSAISVSLSGCTSLTSVTFSKGSTCTRIESEAFMDCRSLREFFIPPNVTEINSHAFEGCSSLRTVYAPKSLKKKYRSEKGGFAGFFPRHTYIEYY